MIRSVASSNKASSLPIRSFAMLRIKIRANDLLDERVTTAIARKGRPI
jgi:hypothetical protein